MLPEREGCPALLGTEGQVHERMARKPLTGAKIGIEAGWEENSLQQEGQAPRAEQARQQAYVPQHCPNLADCMDALDLKRTDGSVLLFTVV
jgi:hypothetical protein